MPIVVFISTVSDEFRAYRDQLVHDLTRPNVAVKVQEEFKDLGGDTLDKLDVYIADCEAVVHLVGDMCGAAADEMQQQALLVKHADLESRLPPVGDSLRKGLRLTYTQWEAWLALYHGKSLLIAKAKTTAPRGPKYAPDDSTRAAQAEHLKRLKAAHRYPGSEFGSPDELAKQIAYSAILDLLVADYARKEARDREVAEGFIREMAKRVAGDKALDLDGMKQAVQNAIEIYETEIAGSPVETNLDAIVSRALASAKTQVDKGKSALARATLRRAAEVMRRDEENRHELYVASVAALYNRERDIALAAYDGNAAADAIIELARSIHGPNTAKQVESMCLEAQALYEIGDGRGSNVHLVAAIALRREQLALASSDDERAAARHDLGKALMTLGERDSGIERLEEAVATFRGALEQRTRERLLLDWTLTQNNLGRALQTLGGRDSGTTRLEEAVAVYRAALGEETRERLPLEWAAIQNNLGSALQTLGARQRETARLEEAVAAFRAALAERTRERVPLDWAATQMNLGGALKMLGDRESGTVKLEEALAAYRSALTVQTQERVPLGWATTQNNLGNVLKALGERENGTARFEEAVAAFRAALMERVRTRVPLMWAATQNNLGNALWALGKRESGTKGLEAAVTAYRAALEELTRSRVPLDWAKTQNNLGNPLVTIGERECGTTRLTEAVAAYGEALKERTRERVPLAWAVSFGNQGVPMSLIADRTNDIALADAAVGQIEIAHETLRAGGHAKQWAAEFEAELIKARAIRDRLKRQ